MVNSDLERIKPTLVTGPDRSDIEQKLESTHNKLLYLIKKVNQISRSRTTSSVDDLTQDRLIRAAERLRRAGLSIEYTDGRGYVKLKAIDQKGIDNLKKLNTIFSISLVESFLDNVF